MSLLDRNLARRGEFLGTLLWAAFLLASSVYCLLAYIPFTYHAFIRAPFTTVLPGFAKHHSLIYVAALAVFVATVKRVRGNALRPIYLVGLLALGVIFLFNPLLIHLRNNTQSYWWALGMLLLAVLYPLIQIAEQWKHKWPTPGRGLTLLEAILAGLLLAATTVGAGIMRVISVVGTQEAQFGGAGWFARGFLTNILFAVMLCLLFRLPASVSRNFSNRERLHFLLITTLWAVAGSVITYRVVFSALPFQSHAAVIYAVLLGIAVALNLASLRLLRRPKAIEVPGGPPAAARRLEGFVGIAALVGGGFAVPALLVVFDWNSIALKLWVLASWIACFLIIRRQYAPKGEVHYPAWALSVCLLVVLGAHRGMQALQFHAFASTTGIVSGGKASSAYESVDPSFRVADHLMTVSWKSGSIAGPGGPRECDGLCEFILEQTNIPAYETIHAPRFQLAADSPPVPAPPNIFVIVVDSLRADYVSALNAKVDFTPNLGAFAKDAVVFRNVYSPYSGTSFAEPAIWSGTMQLHHHYVQPFSSMNSLEHLAANRDYDSYISVDTILRELLDPERPITELEWNRSNWAELDFCGTVQDFASRLRTRHSQKPVFFFTQPTNIHRVALMRLKDRGPKRSYGEFQAAYASELERLDGCFGTFLATLKQHDLYANSIIVVTADHGDAMGDGGRYGHSAKIYPEMLRVPLLVHVPEQMRSALQADVDRLGFITDIAPTIYYLLGHRELANYPIAGRPLLTHSLAEQQPFLREGYLVSADSAPVHGILAENGTRLYILDEVEGEDYLFDLKNDPAALNNIVDGAARRKYQPLIRQHLQQIADFYQFRPDPKGISGWLSR